MSPSDYPSWTVLRRDRVFAGGSDLEVTVEHVRLPDGRELPDFYQVRMRDFALVFAVLEGGDVLLLRQYKHGLRRECLAFPGGALAEGEAPLAAAQRELLEETGCVSEQWSSYGAFVTNANQRCNVAHLFRADRCRRVSAPVAPDLEAPDIVLCREADLLRGDMLAQVGLASHAALLALATHPRVTPAPLR